jgi:hypothetical protein
MNIDGKSNATSQKRKPVDPALQAIEKSLPAGSVKIVTPLVRDESGEVVLACVTWKTPGDNEARGAEEGTPEGTAESDSAVHRKELKSDDFNC